MKKLILTVVFAMFSLITFAQDNTYQLSSHILDISQGKPASGVTIRLEKYNEQTKKWAYVDEKVTDKNGRISDFPNSKGSNLGIYKLTYFTSEYFKKSNTESFYP